MKKLIIFNLFAVFLLYSCGDSEPSDSKSFPYKLQGRWVTHAPFEDEDYFGELIISYNRIIILYYGRVQTLPDGNDMERPFRDFTKGIELEGYSEVDPENSTNDYEVGVFFIKDAGEWHDGIPYRYWTVDYGRVKFLRFTFGGRNETLRHVIPD